MAYYNIMAYGSLGTHGPPCTMALVAVARGVFEADVYL